MDDTRIAVETYLENQHTDLLEHVATCADAVVESWDNSTTTDRSDVVTPLQACLERTGVSERLPAVLAGAVDAAGWSLHAQPVAAPPYVVVTSVGPVLRGTTDRGRLVVSLRVFEVERSADAQTRYARTAEPVSIEVEVK